MTKEYKFNAIPHTVLVNKEGKIIGIGLRGEALENKLETISKQTMISQIDDEDDVDNLYKPSVSK